MSMQAGVGVRDISPQKPMFLIGYPHVERTSTGIHDPLLASALCLTNQQDSVLMIALDILLIDPCRAKKIRHKVSENTGIDHQNIFISCTHTHSGPVTMEMLAWRYDPTVPDMDEDYMELFENEILAAAMDACNNRRDAEIAWTTADGTGVGGNRLAADGVTDSEVGVLAVRDSQTKKLFSMAVIYGMHPTVLHEDSKLVSSDFPYYTRCLLKERFGEDLTVVYHNGPSGNQSPRYYVNGQTFEEAERLGRLLGERISTGINDLNDSDFQNEPSLRGAIGEVELPVKTFPSVAEAEQTRKEYFETYERLKRENAGHGPVRTAECATFGAEELVCLAQCQENGELKQLHDKYNPAEVQVVGIGNCCLVGLPCEIFVEYGLQIKQQSSKKAFVVCLVNGERQGYIVTPEAALAGGYEANNSVFKAESGQLMIDKALSLIQQIQ